MHLHQILGQCTGLVGTNHCNGSHRLACMHLAHQVVGGEHTTHVQRQTECHAHRQAFGHSHHNQGNCHHKVLQSSLQGRQPITEGMERGEVIDQYHILYKENEKSQTRHGKANLSNQVGQFGQLDIQWGRFRILFGTLTCHFTDFRSIAHSLHTHGAMSVHHRCTAQNAVGSIRSLFVKVGFHDSFRHYRLTGQVRFVHLQGNGFQQFTVRRNLFAGFQHHDIAHHHVFTGNLLHMSVTNYFHQSFFVHCVQQVKLLTGIILKEETDTGSQQNGYYNADSLGIFILYNGNNQRKQSGNQQYPHYGVLELLHIQFP